MKGLSLFLSILGFFVVLFAIINDFHQIRLFYAVNFKQSCFKKEVLVLEKYYNVDGEATDLYIIEGYLKENKVKKTISGYMPSLDRDENGDFLVWYCNYEGRDFTLKRKKNEKKPSKILGRAWFNLILIVLFIPSLLYYIRLKILEKNKK
ncbi:hypothetical protein [Tenacibaculum maritimum]|uniref:hypothetical protein n=2 Tax=Tenacibaculum maritimum TaxID=107401 RepID=UPI0012E64CCA|nr:hypothetical protein [Tenacibaculum maritimum]MCD9564192.1 hypothetical protein [Tenacibaculum maritimum]MCD9567035.1 hypothetical protein [Tenacibaculum maritimum]MCD9580250.1 hypothetical protein [Tenacibaculum maritimum]MCD9598017.1 hypothetical protein [Tenacibaculum maritimum]MCD9614903.1 hypothetical protein [Tenacibaculum maritimum]